MIGPTDSTPRSPRDVKVIVADVISELRRAEAQSAAARLVRRLTEGELPRHEAPDVPLPELIGSWLAGVGAAVSRETLRTWELYAGTHFIPHFCTTEGLCSERRLREYMRLRLGVVKARTVQKELSALLQNGVSHDLPQQALAKVPAAMDGHGCAPTIGVLQHNVTPGLAHLRETVRFQHAQKLLRRDGRETLTQTATRTFVIPCSR